MMRPWMNLLPLFLVKRLARKHGEVFYLGAEAWYAATDGVLVRAKKGGAA